MVLRGLCWHAGAPRMSVGSMQTLGDTWGFEPVTVTRNRSSQIMKSIRSFLHMTSTLLLLFASQQAAGFEPYSYGHLSITQNVSKPTASFSAASTSDNATIRDLNVETSPTDPMPDIGVHLPWGLEATYRKYDQAAVHTIKGTATTTSCFRIAFKTFCAALQNTLDGVLKWDFEHQQFALNKRVISTDKWNLRLGLGVDLIKARANVIAGSYNETETGTAPLPYLLAKANYRISEKYDIGASIGYLNLTRSETSVKFLDSELLLTRYLNNVVGVSFGYQYKLLELESVKSAQSASLKTAMKSPFVRVTLGY